MIKEYHIYISGECIRDTHGVAIIYDAQVILNPHDLSFGYVVFIANQMLSIAVISLRSVMEKENVMIQGHV